MSGRSHHAPRSSNSSASSRTPSLSFGAPSISSSQDSISTRQISAEAHVATIDPHTGQIVQPSRARYTCLFSYLNCPYDGLDPQEWRTHCNAHLYSHKPPRHFRCPQCGWQKESKDAWERGLDHVCLHFRNTRRLEHNHPDVALYTYLWNNRIIDDATYRHLTEHRPFKNNLVTYTADSRRQRHG